VFRGENCEIANLDVNFLTDNDIKSINSRYLKHVYSTDIITFQYERVRRKIDGELLISLDTVKENSKFFRTGYKNEFKRVLIHGCLHLAGYDDNTKKRMELIRIKENSYLGI
jgi:probable rRNA maturation factor